MKQNNNNETTNFGFRTIPKSQKTSMILDIFHSVANKYDLMNDIMSFGIHRIWKKHTVQYSNTKSGQRILDIAGGTGDLAAKFAQLVGDKGKVVLADINSSMLRIGRNKLRNYGIVNNINYLRANAESLPFKNDVFDCITISFGLRNFTEKDQALKSMYRVLKPGGRLLVLEFSTPSCNLLKKAYNLYCLNMLPFIGAIIVQDADSYRYLAESIQIHPDQETLKLMILSAGFKHVEYFNITGGIVAIHRGYKL